MRVFLDTNVLVSAVATRGLCADVVREVLAGHELVLSRQVLTEVRNTLRRKLGVDADTAAEYVKLLEQDAAVARPGSNPAVKLRDRDDLPILAAAIAGKADVLVTGDRELVELGKVGKVRVISPRRFWEQLRPTEG